MPRDEKPLSWRIAVGQTAAELRHVNQWAMGGQILTAMEKRRDESRRSSHEWLRHMRQPPMIHAERLVAECHLAGLPAHQSSADVQR